MHASLSPALLLALLVADAAAQTSAPGQVSDDARYQIDAHVLIRAQDGATLSALVVRGRQAAAQLPSVLTVDYADPAEHLRLAKEAAEHGYVGVIADSRGVGAERTAPYEHEVADAYAVIDWIAHQPWSNGQVGMQGAGYSGFAAWAATKKPHSALKTVAVSGAALPGLGLPMRNNVFLNANYGWALYAPDHKTAQESTRGDDARWQRLQRDWFAAGGRYRDMDKFEGAPNPWLQRWLDHPGYDKYWQNMVPYEDDFARLKIPVLTITGYYDDAQLSALQYLKQHDQYNATAEHYLLIGPYDHAGSNAADKPEVLRGYAVDRAAQFSTPQLTYQWMDYVMRGAARPALLADKINYEVMGAEEWHHAESLPQMSSREDRWYLSDLKVKDRNRYRLASKKAVFDQALVQSIDFKDRLAYNNATSYPAPIIEDRLAPTGLLFETEPLAKDEIIAGACSGELNITTNKKDVDLGVTIFEQMADGRLLRLGDWLGRASYSWDSSERQLLVPGKNSRVRFETSLTSRKMLQGSRLLVLLDVNKNPAAQVNYGTGRDVSEESIADAGVPLEIKWHTDSYVNVPLEH